MTNFKINNRTISLTSDQLLLTKQIAILGFASKSHINMLLFNYQRTAIITLTTYLLQDG